MAQLVLRVHRRGPDLDHDALARGQPALHAGGAQRHQRLDDGQDPFQFQNGKITPTLMNEAHAGKGAMIPMFLVVYPDPGVKQKPEVQLEFSTNGQQLGAVPLQLPPPDKDGKIAYIAPWPVEKVPPGQYDVRAVVKQGSETRDEKISLLVN